MSWAIIANPVAGRGRARRLAPRLADRLSARGEGVALIWTTAAGDAETLAESAIAAGATRIVACGGDGTVYQVINGLMTAGRPNSDVILGILPLGRCNDLANSLGIPRNPIEAIETILQGIPRCIDLGRIGDRFFATVATLGFDTEVGRYVASGKAPSFLRGRAAYVYGTLVKLIRYKDVEVHLKGDFGEFHGRIFLAATGNTPIYGGGMMIAPLAVMDDGWLNLCLVRSAPRWDVLRMIPRVFSGGHVKHPAVSMEAIRRLEVSSPQPLWVWADGEPVTRTPTTVEVVPKAISVLVPEAAVEADSTEG